MVDIFNGVEKLSSYNYKVFGSSKNFNNTSTLSTWGYCGQMYDNSIHYYYMRARNYNPAIGRFITEDPIKDGSNSYIYAAQNPVRYWDPSGENFGDVIAGLAETIDENVFGGAAQKVASIINGNKYVPENQTHYYMGRVIGDALTIAVGSGMSISGAAEIISSIVTGTGITVGSGGTLAVGGVTVSVAGVAAGTTEIAYGGNIISTSSNNIKNDFALYRQSYKNSNSPSFQKLNKQEAKKLADDLGYKRVEDLKEDIVGKSQISKYNIIKDKKTGDIYLERISDGYKIQTDYYIK